MQRTSIGLAACAILAGCQTAQPDMTARDNRLGGFAGGTVAGFIQVTGIAPHDYFDVGSERVFIARKQLCTLHVYARPAGVAGRADQWIIDRVVPLSSCGNV